MSTFALYAAYLPGILFLMVGILLLIKGLSGYRTLEKAEGTARAYRFFQIIMMRSVGNILIGMQFIMFVHYKGDVESMPFWLWPIFTGFSLLLLARFFAGRMAKREGRV